jgi:hypothetical protein
MGSSVSPDLTMELLIGGKNSQSLSGLNDDIRMLRNAVGMINLQEVLTASGCDQDELGIKASTLDSQASGALELIDMVATVSSRDSQSTPPNEATSLFLAQLDAACFAAEFDIKQAHRQLVRLRNGNSTAEHLLSACDCLRRRIRRATGTVLQVLGQALGRSHDAEARDSVVTLEASVAVRNMYSRFRAMVPPAVPEDPETMKEFLSQAGIALAVMAGEADFADVRVSDRQLFLEMQNRIIAWESAGCTVPGGRRIAQDLVAMTGLLDSINQCPELIEHDRETLTKLSGVLSGGVSEDTVRSIFPWLESIRGLEQGLAGILDAMTRSGWSPDLLERLAERIDSLAQRYTRQW